MTSTSDSNRQKNRAMFPVAAGIVDALREVFGPGVRLEYAEENGQQIGKQGPEGIQPVIAMRTNK